MSSFFVAAILLKYHLMKAQLTVPLPQLALLWPVLRQRAALPSLLANTSLREIH